MKLSHCSVVFLSALMFMACNPDEPEQQSPLPEKGSGVTVVYKDAGTPVAADKEEGANLIYWFSASQKKLFVANEAELRNQIAEGIIKEIAWTPGQMIAQVMPTPGGVPVQAQVVPFPMTDMTADAIYAQVGDTRRLKYLREIHTIQPHRNCSGDLTIAPVFRPANTKSWIASTRYHQYLQFTGTIAAPETVENTVRHEFHNVAGCGDPNPTVQDRRPKWVTAIGLWP